MWTIWVARSQEIHDPSPNIIEPLTGSYNQYTSQSQLGEKPPKATKLLEYVCPPILTKKGQSAKDEEPKTE